MCPREEYLTEEEAMQGKKIIVIGGYLASGKSTFALKLSERIKVPYIIKDTFKTAICQSIEIADREESSRLSAVTFDAMMYVTERMLETGNPIIIEGNFVPAGIKEVDESRRIRELIHKYGCTSLTFKFVGSTEVLYQRFMERENSPERGRANKMGFKPSYEDFSRWCHNLDPFTIGGTAITVDTTDFSMTDFNKYMEEARVFLNT